MTEGIDFERTDVAPGLVAKLAVGFAAFVLAVPLAMPLAYPQTQQSTTPRPPRIASEAAVLEVNPRAHLVQFESRESVALDQYGWIDRDHGIVQIPIERAMQLLTQRGLSGWPSAPSAKGGQPGRPDH
jgi:hypothetical protein